MNGMDTTGTHHEQMPLRDTPGHPRAAGQFSLRVVLLTMLMFGVLLAITVPFLGEVSLAQVWSWPALLTATGVAVILGAALAIRRRRRAETLVGRRLLEMPHRNVRFERWFTWYFVILQLLFIAGMGYVLATIVYFVETHAPSELTAVGPVVILAAAFVGGSVSSGYLLGATLGDPRREMFGRSIVFGEHGVLTSRPTFYRWEELRRGPPGPLCSELTLQVVNRRPRIYIPDEYRQQAEVILAEKLNDHSGE